LLEGIFNKLKSLKTKRITIKRSDKHQDITGLSPTVIKQILLNDDINTLLPLYHLMVERDLHLASEINKRKVSFVSLPYRIECEDENIKNFISLWCEDINIHSLLMELGSSLVYGFCAIDFIWGSNKIEGKDYFTPISYSNLNQRFIYGDNEIEDLKDEIDYLFINQNSEKLFLKDIDTRKVLTHFHKIDTGNITDYSILKKVAWFIALKHMIISHNMNYYDTLSVPPLIIKTNKSDDEEALNEIMSQALSLRSNSVAIFGENDAVELLSGKSSNIDFLSFIDKIDSQISTFINGSNLSDTKGKGSYALGKVQQDIGEIYTRFDSVLISNTMTKFIRLVVDINFSNPKPIKWSIKKEQTKDLELLSKVYKNIHDMGYNIPIPHIEDIFNIKDIKRETTPSKEDNGKNKQLNKKTWSKNLDHIDDELDTLYPSLKPIETNIKHHLMSILKQANNYDEALDLISKNYQSNDLSELEKALSQVIQNSEMIGLSDD